MTIIRRRFLMEPGEPLLLCRSTLATAARFAEFVATSGVDPREVLSSPLCAMPLPVPDRRTVGRRWAGTRPEMMWHPLMWLPERVAYRYQIVDPDTGAVSLEDDDLWAIRVAFELTASGLYDPESGTWVDILATVGLDVEDELDVDRVADWLDGAEDSALDAIDLGPYLDIEPESWAIDSAMALRSELTRASWALIADDLLDAADQVAEAASGAPHTDLLVQLRSLAGLSEALLSRVPNIAPDGTDTGAAAEAHVDFFARVHDEADSGSAGCSAAEAGELLGEVRDRLYAIREAHWAALEALGQESEASV